MNGIHPLGHQGSDSKALEDERRKAVWRIVSPKLEVAQQEILEASKRRSQVVQDFFDERAKHLHEFAERVLSFRSKWELAWSTLPYADKEGHKKFLQSEFENIVFSGADLTKVITAASEGYVQDVTAIENALLTKVRADIQDYPGIGDLSTLAASEDLFRARFSEAANELSKRTGTDVWANAGQLVASELAAAIVVQVARAVATRLGISAGVLGTGAAFSPETLGISLLAGIVMDQVVGWVVGWFYDPTAQVEAKMHAKLSNLASLIVHGDSKTEGLEQQFDKLAAERRSVRDAALRQVILQNAIAP